MAALPWRWAAHRLSSRRCRKAAVGLLVLAGLWAWADAAVNRYVESTSPPGRVDGASVYFQNVTHSSAVLRWAAPERGAWGMEIEGYRLRIRSFLYTEQMFDISLVDPDERCQSANLPSPPLPRPAPPPPPPPQPCWTVALAGCFALAASLPPPCGAGVCVRLTRCAWCAWCA